MTNRIARYQGCDDKTMFLLERDNDVLWYCAKNNMLTLCFGSPVGIIHFNRDFALHANLADRSGEERESFGFSATPAQRIIIADQLKKMEKNND